MEYSSTETYANRYDLDEFDVFLEGNSNNPMFFNISGLPPTLAYGKHYFNLSTMNPSNQQYELSNSSTILFEFKSSNNVVLKSEVSSVNQRNGMATCYVEILQDPLRNFEEIEDGEGTLTIVGSLQDRTILSGERIAVDPIPEKFIGAMNYRCIFPINISKNILNADSPFILQSEHSTETIKGQFSFAKASISPLKNSAVGLTYNGSSGLPNQQVKSSTIGRAPS